MKAPARLGLYGLTLLTVFAVSGVTANTVIDEDTVQAWTEETPDDHDGQGDGEMSSGGQERHAADSAPPGLGLTHDGYQLTEVSSPTEIGIEGELSFAVTGPDGEPVTSYELDHEKEMHLIVVRSDGQHFRHVHPERDESGTWSTPWEWEAAGTYRIFTDFLPEQAGEGLTLSATREVAGDYDPAPADQPVTETTVDGFDVAVEGDLIAGEATELTMTISRDGMPVAELEPYLGAFGHLVALRDGDLAYLHVHPHDDVPASDETAGPEIVFEAAAPTPGRYLLYLDFQVNGGVHTASLVMDTTTDTGGGETEDRDGRDEEGDDHDH
ncbi:heavy-metal-associated domain-containing protein [Nesterenkonia populi]